jgi:hypothetical protein
VLTDTTGSVTQDHWKKGNYWRQDALKEDKTKNIISVRVDSSNKSSKNMDKEGTDESKTDS